MSANDSAAPLSRPQREDVRAKSDKLAREEKTSHQTSCHAGRTEVPVPKMAPKVEQTGNLFIDLFLF